MLMKEAGVVRQWPVRLREVDSEVDAVAEAVVAAVIKSHSVAVVAVVAVSEVEEEVIVAEPHRDSPPARQMLMPP